MPAISVLAISALLLMTVTPVAFATRGEPPVVSVRERLAPVVSHDGSPPMSSGETRGIVAPSPLATPGAAIRCRPPARATPTPTPELDDSSLLGPTPTPAPDPDAVVDPLLDSMTATAAATLEACWNDADWDAVVGLVSPRFLETALGIDVPDAAARAREMAALQLGPLRIETIGSVSIWTDGRGAVDVFYVRGRGHPAQAVAARWFLTAERGVVSFDEEAPLLPPPLGHRVTIGFAIADDQQPMQWNAPVGGQIPLSPVTALHGANRGRDVHTFLLEGTGAETLGILTLPPWGQGDLVLLDLPAGVYRLHDPKIAGSELLLRVTE